MKDALPTNGNFYRYIRKIKDVMKMSMPGGNLGGTATPLGGAGASVADSWGKGWGMLGNKVSYQPRYASSTLSQDIC